MNILCAILDHKDPVMFAAAFVPKEQLYENWKNWERVCDRCGKDLRPKIDNEYDLDALADDITNSIVLANSGSRGSVIILGEKED